MLVAGAVGFIEQTEARQISYEDSLRFGQMHEDIYREWGYECIKIPPDPVAERIKTIKSVKSIVSNP